jgi:transcriptional regulator with PAS, ATPase and Fis domain
MNVPMRPIAGSVARASAPETFDGGAPSADDRARILPLVLGPQHDDLVAQSPQMRAILEQARRIARTAAPVLITGDSGTGKEGLARLIHRTSPRHDQPYVRVNCAALSETLIESELFGHERGAFTGAVQQRVGRFEWVGHGTLLLDEISEIPLKLQAKLLRVLEEEEFQRVGSNASMPMKGRVVATSNRSLRREVAEGRFREDLYYRLNVVQLELPPLRERREDIPLLLNYFLDRFRHEGERPVDRLDDEATAQLVAYDWPGNVRQLRNVVRRICILAGVSVALVSDLPELPSGKESDPANPFEMTIKDASRLLVQAALRRYEGNRTAAARHLGITVRTLHNWLKQRDSAADSDA